MTDEGRVLILGDFNGHLGYYLYRRASSCVMIQFSYYIFSTIYLCVPIDHHHTILGSFVGMVPQM